MKASKAENKWPKIKSKVTGQIKKTYQTAKKQAHQDYVDFKKGLNAPKRAARKLVHQNVTHKRKRAA